MTTIFICYIIHNLEWNGFHPASSLCCTTPGCHHSFWVTPCPAARPFMVLGELGAQADMSPRSHSFTKPILQTFSLVTLCQEKKCGLYLMFSPLYPFLSSPVVSSPPVMILLQEWKKSIWQCLPYCHWCQQGGQGQRIYSKPWPSLHLFFVFCHDFSTKDPKCKSPLSPFLVLQLYKVKG